MNEANPTQGPTCIVNGREVSLEEFMKIQEITLAVIQGEEAEARAAESQLKLIVPLDATQILAAIIRAKPEVLDGVSPESVNRMTNVIDDWNGGAHEYKTGDYVTYGGLVWRCLQAHQSQESWAPDVSPSLWAKVLTDAETVLPWEQPSSTNPYMKGDRVLWDGKVWESEVDNNVWMPGVYGWTMIGAEE